MKVSNKLKILDCTLRDGGYHNNWKFNQRLINDYLFSMSKTGIEYIELGFRFLNQSKKRGKTAYTKESFIKKLNIPKNLKIGVMINASDFLSNSEKIEKLCEKCFPKLKSSKIKFVRIACHSKEIRKINPIVNWLKKRGILITLNLMQISEISNQELKKILKGLSRKKIDTFYVADSLGSMQPKQIKEKFQIIKKNWSGEIGIHAHNNLNQAMKNTVAARLEGANWLDCTVLGMGRGPGNTKTEDLYKFFKRNDKNGLKKIKRLLFKYFFSLKKEYKWGTNKYYKFAAKYKIHPTYIQEILSDKRYTNNLYKNILTNLKETDSRKYNPFKLISPKNTYIGKAKGRWKPFTEILGKNVLIIGAGKTAIENKAKLEKFIKKYNLFVISLNTNNNINEKYVNLRTASHPFRVISDLGNYSKKTDLAIPLSMLSANLREKIKINKKRIKDYGIMINLNKKFLVKKHYCILPNALAISYSLAIAIAGKAKKIFLAGFDGYDEDDSKNDETDLVLKIIKKTYRKLKILSITKTKYNLKYNIS